MTRPWRHDSRDVEPSVPARLTREAGTADGLIGDGMGLGCLGLQVHRLQGLQSVGLPGAPQKHWRNKLTSRTWGKAMFPWTPPSLLPSPVPDPHPLAGESKASSLPPPPVQGERPQQWLPRGGASLSRLHTHPVSPKSDRLGPGTFRCCVAMLAPGQTYPQATKYKETIKG